MEIIPQEKLRPYLTIIKWSLLFLGASITSILLVKDLYYYTWDEKMETIIYSIPMVFIFFLWIRYRLDERYIFEHSFFLIDFSVVGLAAVRILGLLYHSGHVLFLLYTLITTKNKTYQWIAGIMLAFTISLKLFYWNDFITPIIGAVLALFFAWLRNRFQKKAPYTNVNGAY